MNVAKLLQQAGDHLGAGEAHAANEILRRLLKKKPAHPDGLNLAGVAAYQLRDFERARKLLGKVVQRHPAQVGAHLNLGAVHNAERRYEDAERCYLAALRLEPANAIAWTNLGKNHLDQNKLAAARQSLERAAAADPSYWIAHHNLGTCLFRLGETAASIEAYGRAIQLSDNPTTLAELVLSLRRTDRFTEEVAAARRLLAMPGAGDCAIAAFETLFDAFDWPLIEQHSRRFIDLLGAATSRAEARSGGLILLNSLPAIDSGTVFACHRGWAASLTPRALTAVPRPRSRTHAPLRVAYLSPDFREHSVGFFIRDLIQAHDHRRFEIYCYANSSACDGTTTRIAAAVRAYRDVSMHSDAEFAATVVADGIDILIDLAGHTRDSRLAALHTRLAPVQISYLGYPNTSGLDTIDFRITDPYADTDRGTRYSEKLLHMPRSFLCFGRFDDIPRRARAPVEERGHITFGSFNNIRKLTPAVIAAWSAILERVPNARFVIKSRRAAEDITRRNLERDFAGHGIDPARLEFRPVCAERRDHLASYNDIDIALDTFPYHGTTTTCEALWMGVPVITFAGQVHAQRVGYSILRNAGLERFVTWSSAEYIEAAVDLARAPAALGPLRAEVRTRLEQSILCLPAQFAREFETLLEEAMIGR